jgi:hypothetical protein
MHALVDAALACVELSEAPLVSRRELGLQAHSNYQAEVALQAEVGLRPRASLLVRRQQRVPKRARFHGLATVGESPQWVSPRRTSQRPAGSLWSAFAAFARGFPVLGA